MYITSESPTCLIARKNYVKWVGLVFHMYLNLGVKLNIVCDINRICAASFRARMAFLEKFFCPFLMLLFFFSLLRVNETFCKADLRIGVILSGIGEVAVFGPLFFALILPLSSICDTTRYMIVQNMTSYISDFQIENTDPLMFFPKVH